jgi:hypothetical protein
MDDDTLPSHSAEGYLGSPPATGSDTRRSPNGHASVPLNESPMYTLEGGEEPADGWCVHTHKVTLCISPVCCTRLHTPCSVRTTLKHTHTHTHTGSSSLRVQAGATRCSRRSASRRSLHPGGELRCQDCKRLGVQQRKGVTPCRCVCCTCGECHVTALRAQRVGVFGRSIIPTVVHSHLVEATLTPSRLPDALRVHRHKRRTSHLARLALRLPLLQLIGRPRSTHNNKLPAGRYRRHLVSAAAGGRAHGEHCHPHPPPCLLAAHPRGVEQYPQRLGENARLALP